MGKHIPNVSEPLIKLQKRAIRIISFAKRLAHTSPIFEGLKILSLNEIHIYFVQLFMFEYYHGTLAGVVSTFFIQNRNVH